MPLFERFWNRREEEEEEVESEDEAVVDKSAHALSHVGTAAYEVLRTKHAGHHHELWNVTTGKVVGKVWQTPADAWTRHDRTDPLDGHDDWFPEKIAHLISRTEEWCDIMSLVPPDGLFLQAFKDALRIICERNQVLVRRVTIRMMFGNIIGMPVNCNLLIEELTKDLPEDASSKLKLWVGSWRKGMSWNHAKIIAVDGKYLWTGGHNFSDYHYLKNNPVCDLSLELEGGVANDAHRFANAQWGYVLKKQSTAWGRFVDKRIPDGWDVPRRARVTVSEFPETSTAEFPPYYRRKSVLLGRPGLKASINSNYVPMITIGRYGVVLKEARPSDDAIIAMFDAAKHVIRLALQDIGPILLPGTKLAIPGSVWPVDYLNVLAKVIWTKGVDVEIVLSNPNSIPGDLSMTEANYGNGWNCVDVAAEIIKAIKAQFPDAHDGDLRQRVQENLRLCFSRCPRGGTTYKDGRTIGFHAKHFIIDDICCYIGSQNLYICDLAEWGVVIDDSKQVKEIKAEYWDPMWEVSYTRDDCDVDAVMDGLEIDRSAPSKVELTKLQIKQAKERTRASMNISRASIFHAKQLPARELDDIILEEDDDTSDGED